MLSDFDAEFCLSLLPCGCTVDICDADSWSWSERKYHVACPWCGAVFEVGSLSRWMKLGEEVGWSGAVPNPLILYGDGLLEITGGCDDCGRLRARESCGQESKCMSVSAKLLSTLLLRN